MIRMTILILMTIAMNSLAHADSFAEPSDAVDSYITGVSTGTGAAVTAAFADNAEIQYYNQDGEYRFFSRDEFAELVDGGDDWDASIEITNLLMTGHAANATVEFTWGENGEHGYVDYLNLIKTDDGWKITNKVAQYIPRN